MKSRAYNNHDTVEVVFLKALRQDRFKSQRARPCQLSRLLHSWRIHFRLLLGLKQSQISLSLALLIKFCLGLYDQITLVRVPGSSALEVKITTCKNISLSQERNII